MAKRQTTPTCQVTKESLACTWYFFNLLLQLPIWPLVLSMSCFILWCDIDGFVEVVNHLFPPVSVSLSVCGCLCATLRTLIYYCDCILTLFFHYPVSYPVFPCLMSLSCRNKRSSVPTTECIFELPHFTVQATRAQTLLIQAICQSWTHSVFNGAPLTLSESLLNEVYKSPGKQHALQ